MTLDYTNTWKKQYDLKRILSIYPFQTIYPGTQKGESFLIISFQGAQGTGKFQHCL